MKCYTGTETRVSVISHDRCFGFVSHTVKVTVFASSTFDPFNVLFETV